MGLDFCQINTKETKDKTELYPEFVVKRSKDLMVQGRSFYAIWDEEAGLWSRDEYDVARLVDTELKQKAEQDKITNVKWMANFSNSSWKSYKQFVLSLSDNSHPLDTEIIFADQEVKKSDYASRKLSYSLNNGPCPAWDELVGTLYSVEERAKIEWAIGSIIAGDSKRIQKFFVFYGPAGSGKSTILSIIEKLFEEYVTSFDGKALGNANSSFATEVFKSNPLVAIQHDSDLSRLEDNTRLNSIISHENMTMNEKFKASYTSRVDAMLFIGSNQPVKISDAKSGLIRRLIDIHPTGVRMSVRHYTTLMSQIDFELGAIANHCLNVYQSMGKNYYNSYRPVEMMLQTDIFFNFVEAYYDILKSQDYTTLKQAYGLYKEFCGDTGIERPLPQYKMREELRNYFDEFKDRVEIDGKIVRSVYHGFNAEKFKTTKPTDEYHAFSLVMEEKKSLLDDLYSSQPAQLANEEGTPQIRWNEVTTTLADLNTRKLHFVKVPEKHIVIDFDLQDQNGHKALERNLEAASAWPATYAEISQSGKGIHLHYDYTGKTSDLARIFSEGIEIKTFRGDASLRRKVTKCNNIKVAELSGGLPLKKKEKMLKEKTIKSEKGLRELIERNLKKEIHPGTKPSIDFIFKILEDAYESDLKYDVTDMRSRVIAFANNSTHQAKTCLNIVHEMKFSSKDEPSNEMVDLDENRIVFFDVEVYKNLFVICWKYQGSDVVVKMINPSAHEVEALLKLKLVGFYNRRYDNHILYAASLGKSNMELFKLSSKLINNDESGRFISAYSLSYADIWDFSSVKQGLKKFEIDLGITHMELDIPWEDPVDEKDWDRVVEYCANDVRATEAVFEARKEDFTAREILAELSGLTVNDTTQRHTAKIIFGDDKNPQDSFVYTDLSKEFPGYEFDAGKSTYKGLEPSEGGYVYAEPGIYENVAVIDVASMHPTSIEKLNLFGKYTENYSALKKARLAIKRRDFDLARTMMDGKLAPYLKDEAGAEKLSYALKIVINIVYGLTSAKFNNQFKDNRNVDNIVAKRGALFMIDVQEWLQKAGHVVCHIKTDSVKIPGADEKTIGEVITFGSLYGYEFEHETTYDKFCLVNDAVYIAREGQRWTAVGAQFQHPYVFKTLFSHEELSFDDYCESRSVTQGTMYLDMEDHDDEDQLFYRNMRHLGRSGRFVPVNNRGGTIYRVKDDKYYVVASTKGHKWIDAEIAKELPDLEIDLSYFEKLRADAIQTIEEFGSYEDFVK